MRREDFVDHIKNMDELFEFLCDRGLTDIVYEHCFERGDYVEEMTNDSLQDIVEGYDSWDALRDRLNEINEELSEWYSTEYGCTLFDAEPIESDGVEFQNLKDGVLEYMDSNWDEYPQDEDWTEEDKEEFNAELLW